MIAHLIRGLLLSLVGSSLSLPAADPIPGSQIILCVAPDWNSPRGQLRLFSRDTHGNWRADSEKIPVNFGKNGLAWGIGRHGAEPGPQKKERDNRAPAGIFKIGRVYGKSDNMPEGSKDWPYHQVGSGDAWVDDVTSPLYNQHVVVDPKNPPAWFEKQKMDPHDFAYEWRILVEHNYPRAKPGAGSAIFLHLRRGIDIPSAGCTVMHRDRLGDILRWLDPKRQPVLVQLPREEYLKRWKTWGLPSPDDWD
ncbi:MAG: L,D-transpeptidase family protein [Verrucomicrobiae bacterium]|nr:L,D-transpeptidase family protein [Verrucomicrobiae bacterium]